MNREKQVVAAFFALFLLVGVSVYKDYGISADEETNRTNGLLSFNYVFRGDKTLLSYRDRDYGVAFELPLFAMEKIAGLSYPEDSRVIYLLRHLFTFLGFYLGVFFFFLLCRKECNSTTMGLAGAAFLVMTPRIFADAFYNSKDIIFMSAFIAAVYTMEMYLEKRGLRWAAVHAFACAFLFGVRIVGGFVVAMTILFFSLRLMGALRPGRIFEGMKPLIAYVMLFSFLATLFWPASWQNPLDTLVYAIQRAGRFPWGGYIVYLGGIVKGTEVPWHYIPVWITVSTPPFYLLLFITGIFVIIKECAQKTARTALNQRTLRNLIWLIMPPLAVILLKSIVYDGWRHLFFIYPAMLLVSLMGLSYLFHLGVDAVRNVLPVRNTSYKFRLLPQAVICLVVFLGLLPTAQFMIENHPHQNVYFNFLTGDGMRNAKDNFELDYWGLSYRRGLEYVLQKDARDVIKVKVMMYPGVLNRYILPRGDKRRIVYTNDIDDADYILGEYREMIGDYPFKNEVYSIRVGEVRIMSVFASPREREGD